MNANANLAKAVCRPFPGGSSRAIKGPSGWEIDASGKSIFKSWNCKNFVKSLAFCNRIGDLAEAEGHHPDLHLTGYRHVRVVLTTHASVVSARMILSSPRRLRAVCS